MKKMQLTKMSTLLDTLEIVSNNAKKKGHRSGYRCHELALQIKSQFDIFKPCIDAVIHNKEIKNNPNKNYTMTSGEFEIYQVIRRSGFMKTIDVFLDTSHNKSKNTVRQYIHILQKKGVVKSIKNKGKNYKYYKAIPLHLTTMDTNLIKHLVS